MAPWCGHVWGPDGKGRDMVQWNSSHPLLASYLRGDVGVGILRERGVGASMTCSLGCFTRINVAVPVDRSASPLPFCWSCCSPPKPSGGPLARVPASLPIVSAPEPPETGEEKHIHLRITQTQTWWNNGPLIQDSILFKWIVLLALSTVVNSLLICMP